MACNALSSAVYVTVRDTYDEAAVLRSYKSAGVVFHADVGGVSYVLLGHLRHGGPPEGPHPWGNLGGGRDRADKGPADTAARKAAEDVDGTLRLTGAQVRQALGGQGAVRTVHDEGRHHVLFLAPIAHGAYPAAFAALPPRHRELAALGWHKVRWCSFTPCARSPISRGTRAAALTLADSARYCVSPSFVIRPSFALHSAQLDDVVAAAVGSMAKGSLGDCYLPGTKCLLHRELVAALMIAREAGVLTAL